MLQAPDLRLHEELLLLSLHDRKGSIRVSSLGMALGAGLLAELVLEGRAVYERGAKPSKDRILPADPKPLTDAVLDGALAKLRKAKKPRAPKAWVMSFSQITGLRKQIGTALSRRGILRERRARVLGVFPWTYFPQLDPSAKRRVVERLRTAVEEDGEVDERTALLVAIAASTGILKLHVGKPVMKTRKARIEGLVAAHPLGAATKQAVEAAQAAAAAAAAGG